MNELQWVHLEMPDNFNMAKFLSILTADYFDELKSHEIAILVLIKLWCTSSKLLPMLSAADT